MSVVGTTGYAGWNSGPKLVVELSASMKWRLISGTHLGPLSSMSSRICRSRSARASSSDASSSLVSCPSRPASASPLRAARARGRARRGGRRDLHQVRVERVFLLVDSAPRLEHLLPRLARKGRACGRCAQQELVGSLSREVSRAEIGPRRTFSSIGDRSMPPRRQSAPAPSASGAASADPCARSAAHRPSIMRSTPAPAPTPEMDAHARSTMIAEHRPGRRAVRCVHNEPAPFMSAARSMAPAVFRSRNPTCL
jgi:hypothetical protein